MLLLLAQKAQNGMCVHARDLCLLMGAGPAGTSMLSTRTGTAPPYPVPLPSIITTRSFLILLLPVDSSISALSPSSVPTMFLTSMPSLFGLDFRFVYRVFPSCLRSTSVSSSIRSLSAACTASKSSIARPADIAAAAAEALAEAFSSALRGAEVEDEDDDDEDAVRFLFSTVMDGLSLPCRSSSLSKSQSLI